MSFPSTCTIYPKADHDVGDTSVDQRKCTCAPDLKNNKVSQQSRPCDPANPRLHCLTTHGQLQKAMPCEQQGVEVRELPLHYHSASVIMRMTSIISKVTLHFAASLTLSCDHATHSLKSMAKHHPTHDRFPHRPHPHGTKNPSLRPSQNLVCDEQTRYSSIHEMTTMTR